MGLAVMEAAAVSRTEKISGGGEVVENHDRLSSEVQREDRAYR